MPAFQMAAPAMSLGGHLILIHFLSLDAMDTLQWGQSPPAATVVVTLPQGQTTNEQAGKGIPHWWQKGSIW
jgi:hypothetical protein